MKLKRLVATFGANFDSFVNKVENHEAVADAMIEDVRAAAAKLNMQKARNVQQLHQLNQKRQKQTDDVERWKQRAMAIAETDETRALECVKRFKQQEKLLAVLDAQINEHESLDIQLQQRLASVEERISGLQFKRTALSSRTAKTKAVTTSEGAITADIDSLFDRWEESVVKDEYLEGGIIEPVDTLDKSFSDVEEMDDLKATLADLNAQSPLQTSTSNKK